MCASSRIHAVTCTQVIYRAVLADQLIDAAPFPYHLRARRLLQRYWPYHTPSHPPNPVTVNPFASYLNQLSRHHVQDNLRDHPSQLHVCRSYEWGSDKPNARKWYAT